MTVPPYVLACIGVVSGAWLAARTGRRASFIIGSAFVAILGMTHCSCLKFSLSNAFLLRLYHPPYNQDTYVTFIMRDHVDSNDIAGAQYMGVHFATLGVYTGEALLLR